ncbi:hypothetical protein [Actinomycetospora chiangmaiensis]|uniref:hypothetical protein n=1 Tax=Actinomycetospora chiangmaiensis TaxID=402650 RepID=UPI00037FA52B|nr:hypothetical protein [Actinomycetospora chiangmaiensis]
MTAPAARPAPPTAYAANAHPANPYSANPYSANPYSANSYSAAPRSAPIPSVAAATPWFARPVIAVAAVLVALLAVGGGSYLLLRSPSTTTVATAPTSVTSVGDAVQPSAAAAGTSGATADPHAQLQSLANADSAAVEGFVGSWIPQLSSKRPGLVADGQTWDDAAILAEHQSLRSAHPEARVLWTGDFANYAGRNFWATVVGVPMPTAAAANAWCDRAGLDADHCYAVRLTHTGGPEGNAVMRPHG